ncbi:MAG: hypothetical protein IKO57_09800 [Treponema sp.]|nr:hypothetical protein [Treponema sp.]MBR4630719.1 hypothetical protein [Treponema sp.]MBR6913537.1 hypothetical protein [Treponema sp.]
MGDNGKKFSLNLPLKIILSEEGTSHFISNKMKLTHFKLADDMEEVGISVNPFKPQSVQNMIMVDYISKMEISMSEFVSVRQDVMDLSKMIVFSLMYKQFDRALYSELVKCDCVLKYNRNHPRNLIDESTRIPDAKLRPILAKNTARVTLAKKAILDPVWKAIVANKNFSPEERNIYLLMSEKFLNRLSLMNWYVIILFFQQEGSEKINVAIRHLLQEYMEKSRIADDISLLIMELVANNENDNLKKAAKILYNGIEDTNSILFDPEIREKLFNELKRQHKLVTLQWKMGGGSTAIGKQGRLQITLYNQSNEFQQVKDNIADKMSTDTKKKTIIDFYRELPDGEEGVDLGMMYFSYLDESCKKVGVRFESIVNQISDLTVINLIFNF